MPRSHREFLGSTKRGKEEADANVGRPNLTLQGHLETLAELRDAAKQKEKYAAAISAEVSRGKAAGLYVERTEVTGEGGRPIAMTVTFRK